MKSTEVIIIGGGLAGLTAAIHLSKEGVPVILFEKEEFPHHKVCGEYVSTEILPYLEELDLSLPALQPAKISRLLYSTARGNPLQASVGGLGLSRFAFDHYLYREAVKKGATVVKKTVSAVKNEGEEIKVETQDGSTYHTKIVLGAFGKRSNLDKELDRPFFSKQAPWLAVKAHYHSPDFPGNLVALHNFEGGYCGLSKTESGAVNVCYLATYSSFKKHKNPEKYNENVLRENPFLDRFFSEAAPIFEKPLTIAQVSFSPKKAVEDHVLMLGDAAGLLHPLCGNGMAMAIHSAKLASEVVLEHLNKPSFNRTKMEQQYISRWNRNFKSRLRTGKWLQKVLLNQNMAEMSQFVVSKMPFLLPYIIKSTHGKPIL